MVLSTSTLSHLSVRPIFALDAALGIDVWTEDVRQVFFQSASALQRRIFVKLKELQLDHIEFLQLVLPLYGTFEAGHYWDQTLSGHCLTRAKLKQSLVESSRQVTLLFSIAIRPCRYKKGLCALSRIYMDDLLRAAPPEARTELEKSLREQIEFPESQTCLLAFLATNGFARVPLCTLLCELILSASCFSNPMPNFCISLPCVLLSFGFPTRALVSLLSEV